MASTAQKMDFSMKDFFNKWGKSLLEFTEKLTKEILNGKRDFLCNSRSGVFIINFEHILHIVHILLTLTR